MSTQIRKTHSLAFAGAICCFLVSALPAVAQESEKPFGNAFLPPDAAATIVMRVSETLASPKAELYPIEIANAWCVQNIGVPAESIETVQVIAAPPGPTGPMFAAVIRLKQAFELSKVSPEMVNANEPVDLDGRSCYRINTPLPAMLHEYDSKTVVLATTNYMDTVLRAGTDDRERGPLATLADETMTSGQLSLLVSMEPLRPLISNLETMAFEQGSALPVPVLTFAPVLKLVDALVLSIDIESDTAAQRLQILARDVSTAEELERTLMKGIMTTRDMVLEMSNAETNQDDPIAVASQQYMKRIANYMVEAVAPKQSGREVVIEGVMNYNMASSGALVGMLLPAIQSAQGAAARTSSANNLKQIGLAMHNHHLVHHELPGNTSDRNEKPMLSWRVKLLPFIGEKALYHRFHQDEPWDSEHNIKLMKLMPDVYRHPALVTEPGMTVYQRPRGAKLIMNSDHGRHFREILDGLSNTVMVLETRSDVAVAWTQPKDVSVNLDTPKTNLFDAKRLGFNALMGDGAVIFLKKDLNNMTLKSILTAQGGETVKRSDF